jgi:hypothetical protein
VAVLSAAALIPLGGSGAGADGAVTAQGAHAAGVPQISLRGALSPSAQAGCSATGVGSATASGGYWLAGADGAVYSCGDAPWYGSLTGLHLAPEGPVTGIAACGDGFWLASSRGAVYAFGQALSLGGADTTSLPSPIVGIAATQDCDGYWLVAADGQVFGYGDAFPLGSADALHLNQPVVGMAAPPEPLTACRIARSACDTAYWLVAADGGVFTYNGPGDIGSSAYFLGSTGCLTLNRPVVGLVASPDTTDVGANTACQSGPEPPGGYWMVASDGGIFAFGNAAFLGSTGCLRLNRPIVGMVVSPDTTTVGTNTACLPAADGNGGSSSLQPGGYMMVASDGGVFSFGSAPFVGSLPGSGISVDDVVGISWYEVG